MMRWLLMAPLLIGACGGAPKGQPHADVPDQPRARGPWATLDRVHRGAFMREVVLPRMTAQFQAFDGARFANLNCSTCHGRGFEDKTFALPNAELLALDEAMVTNPSDEAKPITAFMREQVTPTMAGLLGQPVASAEHPDGFSCFACHPRKQR